MCSDELRVGNMSLLGEGAQSDQSGTDSAPQVYHFFNFWTLVGKPAIDESWCTRIFLSCEHLNCVTSIKHAYARPLPNAIIDLFVYLQQEGAQLQSWATVWGDGLARISGGLFASLQGYQPLQEQPKQQAWSSLDYPNF